MVKKNIYFRVYIKTTKESLAWLLGFSYRSCFGMESGHTLLVVPPPKNLLFFFLKLETQITEGQYL